MRKAAVVFLVYNRPELTRRVFERIKNARPDQLFVVCDGPKSNVIEDVERVRCVRALLEDGVDWPCEFHREYAEHNMGCRARVASGLNWAFGQVEDAIILEDDCLPDASFFPFCNALLDRYRNDPRIMQIGGTNFAASHISCRESYWPSKHAPIWGWATWSRAWRLYDFTMRSWGDRFETLRDSFANAWEREFWLSDWNRIRGNIEQATTWDVMWAFTLRAVGGLSLLPSENLIENIGVGSDSTHTAAHETHLRLPVKSAPRNLNHPSKLVRSRYRDDMITRRYAGLPDSVSGAITSALRNANESIRYFCAARDMAAPILPQA